MSISDKIKGMMGFGSDEPIDDEPIMDEPEPAPVAKMPPPPPPPVQPSNVIDFNSLSGANAKDVARRMNIVIVMPENFDSAQEIANSIKAKKPVVVNFENTDSEIAKRIVDFISGTTYAIGGEIKKVGRNVFFCAPSNVSVSDGAGKGERDLSWVKK